jgi:hypothetical protein
MSDLKMRDSAIREIKTRQVFQVGCKFFVTTRAAARFETWRLICDKYITAWNGPTRLSEVKHVFGCDCNCDPEWGSSDCEIHNTATGYFKRVHNRLSKRIKTYYDRALNERADVLAGGGEEV